eukprot:5244344-Prorocentrum_lima.AAC.1
MTSSLVGSEMCIRYRIKQIQTGGSPALLHHLNMMSRRHVDQPIQPEHVAVSYTHLTLPTICSV